eukprot:CAMPEP_0179942984 /NCGR_PEP_ID=MMETSP0983-20121128/18003_1 /TAXON_ID=483367 /ORGANISM="non described non described, Strain CCMP 2436" /LENGTH=151 /DNA_ID=CAMNT_0021850513 /DNA_START=33 /DNA_END=485 /DNA_ORIENTATION=-
MTPFCWRRPLPTKPPLRQITRAYRCACACVSRGDPAEHPCTRNPACRTGKAVTGVRALVPREAAGLGGPELAAQRVARVRPLAAVRALMYRVLGVLALYSQPGWSHACGRSPLCVRLCLLRLPAVLALNAQPGSSHTHGRSPLCVKLCLLT